MSEWIRCEDATPDVDTSVMAYFAADKEQAVVNISSLIKACMLGDEYSPVWTQVTHWMPLPERPKE